MMCVDEIVPFRRGRNLQRILTGKIYQLRKYKIFRRSKWK